METGVNEARGWTTRALGVAVAVVLVGGLSALGLVERKDDVLTAATTGAARDVRSVVLPMQEENLAALPPAPYSSTTPTTEPAASTTTAPRPEPVATRSAPDPTTTTVAAPVVTTPPTTAAPTAASSTTVGSGGGGTQASTFMVTIASQFEAPVQLKINGQAFEVAPGQTIGPFTIQAAASGNDVLQMWRSDSPTCGLGDAGGLFQPGKRFLVTVVTAGGSGCGGPAAGLKSPDFRITTV
jgi:hypothetical protein